MLKRNDGMQFDQHLVRRFTQLMGIYPPGNLVRLDNGELGVVVRVYAPDPYRPKVRVIADADGEKLPRPYDVNLWETGDEGDKPRSVISPLDADTHRRRSPDIPIETFQVPSSKFNSDNRTPSVSGADSSMAFSVHTWNLEL